MIPKGGLFEIRNQMSHCFGMTLNLAAMFYTYLYVRYANLLWWLCYQLSTCYEKLDETHGLPNKVKSIIALVLKTSYILILWHINNFKC